MTTVAEAIAVIDEKVQTRPEAVRDAWRIVRGDMRRSERPSTQMPAVDAAEPITAKQRFANVTEALVTASEELKGRGERGGDGG